MSGGHCLSTPRWTREDLVLVSFLPSMFHTPESPYHIPFCRLVHPFPSHCHLSLPLLSLPLHKAKTGSNSPCSLLAKSLILGTNSKAGVETHVSPVKLLGSVGKVAREAHGKASHLPLESQVETRQG
jgi:hypothetical protein